jgi:hypothetical protein
VECTKPDLHPKPDKPIASQEDQVGGQRARQLIAFAADTDRVPELRAVALEKLYGAIDGKFGIQDLLLQSRSDDVDVLQVLTDILGDVDVGCSARDHAITCLFALVLNPSIAKKVRKRLAIGELSTLLPSITDLIRAGDDFGDPVNALGLVCNLMGQERHDTSVLVSQSGIAEAVVEALVEALAQRTTEDTFITAACKVLLKLSSYDANAHRMAAVVGLCEVVLEVVRRGLAVRAAYLSDAVGVLANISASDIQVGTADCGGCRFADHSMHLCIALLVL